VTFIVQIGIVLRLIQRACDSLGTLVRADRFNVRFCRTALLG